MKKIYCIVIVMAVFISCSRQTEIKNLDIEKISIDTGKKAVTDMSEFIEKIEIVPLQTDTDCLLSAYRDMVYCKELDMFIITDMRLTVFLFAGDGTFVANSESVKGRGPGEYMTIVDVGYNPFSKAIELLDPSGAIYRYDTSFHFIDKLSLDQKDLVFRKFMPLSENQYILIPLDDPLLYFCDYDKKAILTPPIDYAEDFLSGVSMVYNPFFQVAGNLYYSPHGLDYYMYHLDAGQKTLTPAMKLDFGSREVKKKDLEAMFGSWQPKNQKDKTVDRQILMKTGEYLIQSKTYPLPLIKFFNEKYVYIYLLVDMKRNNFIYNRETKQSFLQTDDSPFKLCYCLVLDDNVLMGLAPIDEYKEYLDKQYLTPESVQKMNELKEDDNPVIIKYYLR
jgi:hypothetical protein